MAMYDSHPTRTTPGLSDAIRHRLISAESWVLPKQESCIAPEHVWSNRDMDPSPMEHRTWGKWTFFR